MTTANQLTLGRILSAPLFFVLFFLPGSVPAVTAPAVLPLLWLVFILSEVSDLLDGRIARSRGEVTDLGKLMDPFGDVISRITYFVCFTGIGWMPLWALLVILYREFGISFIRMMMFREGEALAARHGGKLKAVFYFVSGLYGLTAWTIQTLFPGWGGTEAAVMAARILFAGAAGAALISFADYLAVFCGFLRKKQGSEDEKG